jgi:hypothetical protein
MKFLPKDIGTLEGLIVEQMVVGAVDIQDKWSSDALDIEDGKGAAGTGVE